MDRRASLVFVLLLMAACLSAQHANAAPPPPAPAPQPEFVFCAAPARFANCTKALCKPKAGGGYSCKCFLDDRYSATSFASTCKQATDTTAQSRYHPWKATRSARIRVRTHTCGPG